MPADILRDRDDASPTTGFADLAQAAPDLSSRLAQTDRDMGQARERQQKARDEEKAALEARATAIKPAIAGVEQAVGQREALAAQHPAPLQLAPPPTRKLTDFLAPVQGEQPENTISKLLQGVGLLASGFTGLKRGNASTALASMQGALKGWHEGDKVRADRAFEDWQAKTETMIAEHRSLVKTYQDIMDDANLTIDQRMQLLKLKGLEAGHDAAVKTFERQNADEDVKFLKDYERQLLTLQDHKDKTVAMAAERQRHDEYMLELKKQTIAMQNAQKQADIKAAMPDEMSLKVMGKDWFVDGKMPSIGQGGKGTAIAVRSAVIKAGIEWAKEMGIDPMSSQTVRAEVASARGALNSLRRVNAVQQAAIRRFDGHADALVKLSDMVPRSEMPAVNAAILRGERDYKGSPEAAAFVFQAFELAMEFSRVVVGTAQGDAATRDEARKSISGALNPAQVRAVVDQARQNAHRNIETNAQSEKETMKIIDTLGGRIEGPPMPPPPMGTPGDSLGILPKRAASGG